MEKIKNIIVPTDFSFTAHNAFQYAQGLAAALEATLTVVQVREYFFPTSGEYFYPLAGTEETQLDDAFDLFIQESDIGAGVITADKVKTQILRGNAVDSLLELSGQENTDLIVIGTTGLPDFLSRISESTSLKVATKAHCPVLLVPSEASWMGIERIMYTSNFRSMTAGMIGEGTGFAMQVEAATHFVHIDSVGFEEESNAEDINWNHLFSSISPNLSYQTHSLYGWDIIKELEKYREAHRIDLMVFVSRHHGFWESLRYKSVIQNMAISTNTPMMVLYWEDFLGAHFF
jgi:nucleotide-binding universal stress UspA family protein